MCLVPISSRHLLLLQSRWSVVPNLTETQKFIPILNIIYYNTIHTLYTISWCNIVAVLFKNKCCPIGHHDENCNEICNRLGRQKIWGVVYQKWCLSAN